jgi:hypothetical protein
MLSLQASHSTLSYPQMRFSHAIFFRENTEIFAFHFIEKVEFVTRLLGGLHCCYISHAISASRSHTNGN